MKYFRRVNDIRKRKSYRRTEIFQRVLKVLYLHKFVNESKLIIQKKLVFSLVIDAYRVRSHNYCVLSTRPRGVYKSLKISRLKLRELGSDGLFFGLKKAS